MIGELKSTGVIQVDGEDRTFNRMGNPSQRSRGYISVQIFKEGIPTQEISVPPAFYADVKFRVSGHWFRYPHGSLKEKKDNGSDS